MTILKMINDGGFGTRIGIASISKVSDSGGAPLRERTLLL